MTVLADGGDCEWRNRSHASHTGPDRDLFLPGGLLDRSELPSYLDGTLPGE